jgi:hypothetical protein
MLSDYLEPLDGGINSVINKYNVNWVEEKRTCLNVTYYSQSMGKGRILFEDSPNKIKYPRPKSLEHTAMKFVCNY